MSVSWAPQLPTREPSRPSTPLDGRSSWPNGPRRDGGVVVRRVARGSACPRFDCRDHRCGDSCDRDVFGTVTNWQPRDLRALRYGDDREVIAARVGNETE